MEEGAGTAVAADGGSGGENGAQEEKRKVPEGEIKVKRKMKTAAQLEILENTYAVEQYPSEELRLELSAKLGLSDRQLQMWFCHRRLKDRKGGSSGKRPRKDSPAASAMAPIAALSAEEMAVGEAGNEHVLNLSPYEHVFDTRRAVPRTGTAVARIGGHMTAATRYYESPQSIAELRAIAFVEEQLGGALREDGPILGMEFDPLPPGAFGAPIEMATVGRHYQSGCLEKRYEQPDTEPVKGTRTIHEYQFLPEQPTARSDAYERVTPSYNYGSSADGPTAQTPFSSGRSYIHGNDQAPNGYDFQGPIPSLNLLPQQRRQGHAVPSLSFGTDAQFAAHTAMMLDNSFVPSDSRVSRDDDVLRMERKRKSEEAKIAREVEAHEKRIRRELVRQDMLRRKREEQLRKEMERQERERRKEEERLLREKQREEERYLKEQRKEIERRERLMQKEYIKAERQRQKEEQRREKEAARLKAANERAIARRIVKESLELIDDERLELMESAAASKGLPSVLSLDYEVLQNLELYRDKLSVFPPKSVQLKRPFAFQPWCGSEDNIGNLLMVWRFLINFADVLGLWPFTLDEFVQALHDYDSRLLGEIHIALLRSIIKDIEDVARTPFAGVGTNQNSAVNPGGGHPQIVEGAYAWGFDIRSWQRHLGPLTWPEILRQFAFSAGFGPQLKKRNAEQACTCDNIEGATGEDIISKIRSGVAAENAAALMQERGYSNPRRSRHRLTPGTVKFAAFHILSLEGSKGLTILEIAEKIQKSGLRDLRTSKTPEASIAAALSRDTKLFERTAPSTYCVRAPYRKDPADTESILATAREKIRVFKSGAFEGGDAERDEEVERDEDSESEVAEDPEVDDIAADSKLMKETQNSEEVSRHNLEDPSGNGNQSVELLNAQGILEKVDEKVHCAGVSETKHINCSINQSPKIPKFGNGLMRVHREDTITDEGNLGEPWVLGLTDGEYSDLTVEERLNALVVLIGVVNEGNSIRLVLEERLEAATALKKQMLAEAQLDKRRMKEELVMKMHSSSCTGSKSEPNFLSSVVEAGQSPLLTVDGKNNDATLDLDVKKESSNDPQNGNDYLGNVPSEGNLPIQELVPGQDNFQFQQQGHVEKSRSQLKSYINHKAEEMYAYRSLPLGLDRRRNRYWRFITSSSRYDPGSGRIFVELRNGCWRLIDSEEDFDALVASLDIRGVRESHLHLMLKNVETSFKEAVSRNILLGKPSANQVKTDFEIGFSLDSAVCYPDSDMSETSSSFKIELGRNEYEKNGALNRYKELENWIWKEYFNSSVLCAMKYGKKRSLQLLNVCEYCSDSYFFDENMCPCLRTLISDKVTECKEKLKLESCGSYDSLPSPLRIRLLKVQLALIEVSLLPEALEPYWTEGYRKSWGTKLYSSSSAEDLLQVVTLLECAIKRDYLSSNFETTRELLGSPSPPGSVVLETFPVLAWVPHTTAAVALRLMELDSSIFYMLQHKMDSQKDKEAGNLMVECSERTYSQVVERAGIPHVTEHFQEEKWADPEFRLGIAGRGRGARGRGQGRTRSAKSQKSVPGSRSTSSRRKLAISSEQAREPMGHKGKTRGRGGRRRGRRSVRNRRKLAKKVVEAGGERDTLKEGSYENSPRRLVREEWAKDEIIGLQVEGRKASSLERYEYGEDSFRAFGDDYDIRADYYRSRFKVNGEESQEGSDASLYGEGHDNDEVDEDLDDAAEDRGGMDVEGYMNADSDDEGDIIGDEAQNSYMDDGAGFASSNYSDLGD